MKVMWASRYSLCNSTERRYNVNASPSMRAHWHPIGPGRSVDPGPGPRGAPLRPQCGHWHIPERRHPARRNRGAAWPGAHSLRPALRSARFHWQSHTIVAKRRVRLPIVTKWPRATLKTEVVGSTYWVAFPTQQSVRRLSLVIARHRLRLGLPQRHYRIWLALRRGHSVR